MLAFFVDALTLALPLALGWTALWTAAARAGRPRTALGIASLLGVVLAVVVTVVRQAFGTLNRELILLASLPVSLLLGVAALAWLWRGNDRTPPRWGRPVLALLGGVTAVVQLPELLLLTRGFAEPGTSLFTSEVVLKLAGYLLGVGLAWLTGWVIFGLARGVGGGAVSATLAGVLGVTVLSQLSILGRILLARRLVTLPRWGFQGLAWAASHEWVFTAALVTACLVPTAVGLLTRRRPLPPPTTPAEGRLQRAAVLTRRRFLAATATSLGATAWALTWGRALADAKPELSPPEPYGSDPSQVWVELAAIDDGHLHRHAYLAQDGTEVRFITIRRGARAFVACLDACEICGPSGYYERDGHVICKLCDVAMNIATIGFKGGCNPIPIDFTVADGRLVIARRVLEDSVPVFA